MGHRPGPTLLDRQAGLGAVEGPCSSHSISGFDGVDGPLTAPPCQAGGCRKPPKRGAILMTMTTIGLDLAKYVFQVHGVEYRRKCGRKAPSRRSQVIAYFASIPPCLVGMEACATVHFWGRELSRLGHEVRLMPPQYVKAYLKRDKNDAADAAAICEAVGGRSMRFVPIKTEEQQAVLVMHRARDLLVRQRTQLIKAFRGTPLSSALSGLRAAGMSLASWPLSEKTGPCRNRPAQSSRC